MELTTNYGWSMPEPTDPVNSSAEYAENMELIDGVVKDIADEVTAVDQGLTALATTVAGKVSKAGDTMSGALNMSGSKIQNLATPTAGSDAATKAYVDNIATTDSIKKDGSVTFEANQSMGGHKLTGLPTSGSYNAGDAIPKQYVTDNAVTYAEGLTSDLNANNNTISALGTPTFNYDAATKKYVDDAVAGIDEFLPLTGGTMDGEIIMNGNAIHQLPLIPTNNADAASKKYVDSRTVDYSTTEQDTGLKWIDGKTIYSKTFEISTTTSSQYSNYTISTTPMDNIIDGKGYIYFDDDGGTHYVYPLFFNDGTSYVNVRLGYPESTPRLIHKEWLNGYTYNGYVTIFYTKTD